MTPIVSEILLLLLAVFVLGCTLGCIARRAWGTSSRTVSQPSERPKAGGATPESGKGLKSADKAVPPQEAEMPENPEQGDSPAPAKPRGLRKARASGADNLKQIKGIGPVLEIKLNALGIHHFSQIARWSPPNVAWVDETLNTRGRIERDDWVGQARRLDEEKS